MAERFADGSGAELGRVPLARVRAERGWNHDFHGHWFSPTSYYIFKNKRGSKDPPLQILNRGAMANLDAFRRKRAAIIVQTPGSHVLRRAIVHADDDVAIPWPGVILIELAGARGMIRMRMIPANDFETLRLRRFVGFEHVFRGDDKAVAGRFAMTVNQREQGQHLARGLGMGSISIAPQKRATAFVGIRPGAVSADFLRQVPANAKG